MKILEKYTAIQPFRSKRNEVLLVEDEHRTPFVYKRMRQAVDLQRERKNLELLHENGVRVPCVIQHSKEALLLEYINGRLYLEVLEELEAGLATEKEMLYNIHLLLDWLQSFYQGMESYYGTSYIRNDVNLRNFIMTDKGVYGIDMELCGPGAIETDIGRVAAFTMMYDPVKPKWKEVFVQCFVKASIERLNLNKTQIEISYKQELEEIYIRRNLSKERNEV